MKPIDIIFPGRQAIMAAHKCVICGNDAKEFKDTLSIKEYGISGMCQQCQDKTFVPYNDEDPCEVCSLSPKPDCCENCPM